MNNLNSIIAIASHKRPEILQSKTLNLLKKHKISMKKVYIFVSPESYKDYIPIKNKWNFNLIGGDNSTILKTRNNIIKYFNEGENIIEMDDDVEDIEVTVKGKKNRSVKNLKGLFNESFDMIHSGGLFGFNANTNNFFASGNDKYGLYSIINSCLGYKNDKRIKLTVSEKEDFERCIKFYELNLPILKRTGYGIKTNYWKNKGGIQGHYDFKKRIEVQKKSAEQLLQKYPWAARKQVRNNGIVDLRFNKDPLKKYKNL
tara:strand:+ start:10682 stop:11455 length:774 start_codon:yes stop_codon:yes gene_type:complete